MFEIKVFLAETTHIYLFTSTSVLSLSKDDDHPWSGWGWVEWVILVAGILGQIKLLLVENMKIIKLCPGGILVIGIVAFVVSKKGYTRAATSGAWNSLQATILLFHWTQLFRPFVLCPNEQTPLLKNLDFPFLKHTGQRHWCLADCE